MRGLASVVVVLAGLVLPSVAEARSLSVEVPRVITAGSSFAVTWSGETGPQDSTVFGGFVVDAYLRSGGGRCPATRSTGFDRRRAATLVSQNVFLAGPLRGAGQLVAPRAGTYRLCGYLSNAGGGPITYERLVDRGAIRVRAARRGTSPRRVPAPASGTFTATTARTAGGGGKASVQIVVSERNVTSARVTDLRLTRCSDSVTPSEPQLNTFVDVASTGPATGLGATLTRPSIAVSLPGPAPDGTLQINGGYASSREIRGIITAETADGVCSGSLAFTARR